MSRFPKKPFEEILNLARTKAEKLTTPFPDNLTSQTVLKTKDVRIDIHKDFSVSEIFVNVDTDIHKDFRNTEERVARIQANTEAQSSSVKEWIRKAKQKGHSGTHKNISEVRYNVKDFDIDDFESKAKANSV